jgi:hypothetical protein
MVCTKCGIVGADARPNWWEHRVAGMPICGGVPKGRTDWRPVLKVMQPRRLPFRMAQFDPKEKSRLLFEHLVGKR